MKYIVMTLIFSLFVLSAYCQAIEYSIEHTIDLGSYLFYGICTDLNGHVILSGHQKVSLFGITGNEANILDTYISDQYYMDKMVLLQDTLYVMNIYTGIDIFVIQDEAVQYLNTIHLTCSSNECYLNMAFGIYNHELAVGRVTLDNAQTPSSFIETYDITNPLSPILLRRDDFSRADYPQSFFSDGNDWYMLTAISGLHRRNMFGEWDNLATSGLYASSYLSADINGDDILVSACLNGSNDYALFCYRVETDSLAYCWQMETPRPCYTPFVSHSDGEAIVSGVTGTNSDTMRVIRLTFDETGYTVQGTYTREVDWSEWNLALADDRIVMALGDKLVSLDEQMQNETVLYSGTFYMPYELFNSRYVLLQEWTYPNLYFDTYRLYDIETESFLDFEQEGYWMNPFQRRDGDDSIIFRLPSYYNFAVTSFLDDGVNLTTITTPSLSMNITSFHDNIVLVNDSDDTDNHFNAYILENNVLVEMASCMPDFYFSPSFIIDSSHFALFENYYDHPYWHFFRYNGTSELEEYAQYPSSTSSLFLTGNTLIFGSDDGLVLDVSDPDNPIQIAGLSLPEEVYPGHISYNGQSHYCFDYNFYSYVTDASFDYVGRIDNIYTRFIDCNHVLFPSGTSMVIAQLNDLPATDDPLPPPAAPALRAWPNPFNPSTSVSFSLSQPGRAQLAVYNVRGQRVRTLVDDPLPAGEHTAVWNGRDDAGRPCASGVYLLRLQTGAPVQTSKALLLK